MIQGPRLRAQNRFASFLGFPTVTFISGRRTTMPRNSFNLSGTHKSGFQHSKPRVTEVDTWWWWWWWCFQSVPEEDNEVLSSVEAHYHLRIIGGTRALS